MTKKPKPAMPAFPRKPPTAAKPPVKPTDSEPPTPLKLDSPERPVTFAVIDELGELPTDSVPGSQRLAGAMVVRVAARTETGRVRKNNEDAFTVVDLAKGEPVSATGDAAAEITSEAGVLAVVSDGMGGVAAGEVASAIVIETLLEHAPATAKDAAEGLRIAVEHANEAVTRAAEERGANGMGATVVAVVFRAGAAWTAEVGDSRIYVVRNGALTRLTHDQTQAQMLVDRGVVTEQAAARSAAKNILLQACGIVPTLVVAQQRVALCRGDRFLLCSDGLTTHVPDDAIADILSSTSVSASETADALVRLALDGGGRDNVTVIVADVDGPSLRSADEVPIAAGQTIRAFALAEDPP